MADTMTFPETWEEFEKSYGFVDGEEVYTNGSRLIPSFRVKQWLDHIAHRENEQQSKQQATVSSDCISRQAAIEAIHEDADWLAAQGSDWQVERMERDKSILKSLPSTEPERKTGKWDFMGWQMFQCSECKHTFTQDFLEGWREYTYESHFPPFCPNCGAKMEGEEE